MYLVKEAFHTARRRFVPGDRVTDSDLAGPVPVKRWIEMGKIEAPKPDKPAKAPPVEPTP